MYRAMIQFKDDLHWFCSGCQAGAYKLLAVMSKMQSKLKRVDSELISLRSDWKADIAKVTADFHDAVLKNNIEQINIRVQQIETDLYDKSSNENTATGSWADTVAKHIDSKITLVAADVSSLHSNSKQMISRVICRSQEQEEIKKKIV